MTRRIKKMQTRDTNKYRSTVCLEGNSTLPEEGGEKIDIAGSQECHRKLLKENLL